MPGRGIIVMPSWFPSPTQFYRLILIGALLILVLFVLVAAWTALVPFFLGVILAYLLMPVVNFLGDRCRVHTGDGVGGRNALQSGAGGNRAGPDAH